MPFDPPPTSELMLIYAFQSALFLLGLGVLWFKGLSPAARRSPLRLATWTISGTDFTLAVIGVLSAGFIAQVLAMQFVEYAPQDDFALMVLSAALQFGLLFGAVFVGLKFNTTTPAATVPSLKSPWRAGALTFVALIPAAGFVAFLWSALLDTLGFTAPPQDLVELIGRLDSIPAILAIVFLAIVVAPVTEELVFRAGLFRFLRGLMPRWAAIAISAVVFGAFHFNLVSFLPLAVIGALLAVAYERTGRVAVPMIAHGLFNLNTLLILFAGVPPV